MKRLSNVKTIVIFLSVCLTSCGVLYQYPILHFNKEGRQSIKVPDNSYGILYIYNKEEPLYIGQKDKKILKVAFIDVKNKELINRINDYITKTQKMTDSKYKQTQLFGNIFESRESSVVRCSNITDRFVDYAFLKKGKQQFYIVMCEEVDSDDYTIFKYTAKEIEVNITDDPTYIGFYMDGKVPSYHIVDEQTVDNEMQDYLFRDYNKSKTCCLFFLF